MSSNKMCTVQPGMLVFKTVLLMWFLFLRHSWKLGSGQRWALVTNCMANKLHLGYQGLFITQLLTFMPCVFATPGFKS